jgi:hypothetical protein
MKRCLPAPPLLLEVERRDSRGPDDQPALQNLSPLIRQTLLSLADQILFAIIVLAGVRDCLERVRRQSAVFSQAAPGSHENAGRRSKSWIRFCPACPRRVTTES